MKRLLRFFFKLLYHQFAFAYDFVAATVSVGRWQDWVSSILPFLAGTRILEIGFGPGHLQRHLLRRGLTVVGIDESWGHIPAGAVDGLAGGPLERPCPRDDAVGNHDVAGRDTAGEDVNQFAAAQQQINRFEAARDAKAAVE